MLGKNTKLNRRNAIKKIAMGTTAITIPKIQNTNYLKKSKSDAYKQIISKLNLRK